MLETLNENINKLTFNYYNKNIISLNDKLHKYSSFV